MAMTVLDKAPRYGVERPLASAMVPMRAVWRLNCSVPPGSRHQISSRARSARMPGRLTKGGAMDPTRKLYRNTSDGKLAGVCAGLAQYFNVDVTLIRVLFVLLAVLGGSGLVLYLAMWIIVPKQP